jgi:hypothetical protein
VLRKASASDDRDFNQGFYPAIITISTDGFKGYPEAVDLSFGRLEWHEIATSHGERNNLTIRTFVKRFACLSLGFSKKLDNLAAAVALHFTYFNYVWRPRRTRINPEMVAGVTAGVWTLEDLFDQLRELKS